MRCFSVILFVSLFLFTSCKKQNNENPTVNTDNKFVRIAPRFDVPTFTSFWFFDTNNGIITTNTGIVLNTHNGGKTWSDSTIEGASNLNNLYFYNKNIGFCADKNNTTYKINGALWNVFDFPVKQTYPSSFFMLSENSIYATTYLGQNVESYAVSSEDGGNSWDTLYSYLGNLEQILMIDEFTGFFIGKNNNQIILSKTTDKGKSWYGKIPGVYGTYYSETLILKKIITLDNNHLIVIGRGHKANQGCVFTSADAGENWDIVLTEHAINDVFATQTDVFFVGDEFFAAQWHIDNSQIENPVNITDNWKIFDPETDFYLSDKGEPASHYNHIIGVHFIDDKHGFILTKNLSSIFKITLKLSNTNTF